MKPMVSLTSLNFSQTLYKVLEFHLPEDATIIDPTPGEKYSWQYYIAERNKPSLMPLKKFNVAFVDDDISTFKKTKKHMRRIGAVNAIFFDPPYIFGSKRGPDVRREDYGEYDYSISEVRDFFQDANIIFPSLLLGDGLVFMKYTDVYSVKDREFFFCAGIWPAVMSNFRVIDHYIIPHHHISPTAWQVKDRPCGIVNYTYLTVLRRLY